MMTSGSTVAAPPRRYHTRAVNSQVDETLFGGQKKRACKVKDEVKKDTVSSKDQTLSGPASKMIRIITSDLIRDLRIPSEDPSGQSIILSPSEISRIKAKSRVLTKEEKEALAVAQRIEKEKAMDAVMEQKALLLQADMVRQKNKQPSDLQVETKAHDEYLLDRSNALRMEQEDEIKKLNELILGAQCHAVRDAQILERQQIEAEVKNEELRLDTMMEVRRLQDIKAQEYDNEQRKQKRIQGKMCILEQINKRQEERMLEDELKEQEGQQMLEKLQRLQMEDLVAMEKKLGEQKKLNLEIQKINEASLLVKERRKEEERLADQRAHDYTRKKMEREAEYEAEQRRIMKEKELEIARMRARQEKSRDHRAEQDAIRARRNQEAAEREWRRKEKEQIKKKLDEEEKLKTVRLQQITHKERMLSIEAGREKAEFERVQRVQRELMEREKEKEERHRQELLRHAKGIRQQVQERELQAIAKRREVFLEGERLEEEARNRRIRIELFKEKKLKDLKNAGLPDKYCSEVERKMFALPKLVQ